MACTRFREYLDEALNSVTRNLSATMDRLCDMKMNELRRSHHVKQVMLASLRSEPMKPDDFALLILS